MPIMILGLVFVIGLFVFYLISTRTTSDDTEDKTESDLKTEGNIVFLPKDLEKEKKKHHKK